MKSTENFKQLIDNHLKEVAKKDPIFAKTLAKPNKNIDECITYILNTVKKSGCVGFADEEIFGMAIHYYDEDDIKAGKPIDAKVVVNRTVAPEKKAETKKKAPAKTSTHSDVIQTSLF